SSSSTSSLPSGRAWQVLQKIYNTQAISNIAGILRTLNTLNYDTFDHNRNFPTVKVVRVHPRSLVLAPYAKREVGSVCLGRYLPLLKGIKEPPPPRRFAIPLNRSFLLPPSSSSRLALCPPTRCRSVSAMQATAPILPHESPGRA